MTWMLSKGQNGVSLNYGVAGFVRVCSCNAVLQSFAGFVDFSGTLKRVISNYKYSNLSNSRTYSLSTL